MAMVDYGAIAFKNGKCIQTDMFTPMIDMVGWEDTEKDTYRYMGVLDFVSPYNSNDKFIDKELPLDLKDEYFAYIGDDELTLAFYKTSFVIVTKKNNIFDRKYINVVDSHYTKWEKWEYHGGYFHKDTNHTDWYDIKIKPHHGYYVLKMKYKGDKYKVYFGFGVDYDYYKKWHIVNYYRYSPSCNIRWIKRWIKDKIYDWRYLR